MGGIYYLHMSLRHSGSLLRKTSTTSSIVLLVITLVIVVIGMLFVQGSKSGMYLRASNSVYTLAVAGTPAAQEKGLGGRAWMPQHEGMIFVFDTPDTVCFWMKDMHFAIDMIWLNEAKKVVHLQSDVAPGSYPKRYCPPMPAKYVVELRAGEAARQSIRTGTTLMLE